MSELSDKTCVPCTTDVPALKGPELARLHGQIPAWELVGEHHLKRRFRFADFRRALDFVNRVGVLAEEQGHHPDIGFGWGWAEITIFTHNIDGLTENDFILAAKVDGLQS
ncbi:MAG: 4a-hydroxytetrahydrobiopterin dehydratase [Chloroflexota bacterium]|nr:4a-hydroxytetrahydrobiopterin dehydratase [Chloroflexota bacterium]